MRRQDAPLAAAACRQSVASSGRRFSSGEIPPWRCSWAGGESRPICARWRVTQFPSVYVLDHTGRIRAKDVNGQAFDEVVERLLEEMDPSR